MAEKFIQQYGPWALVTGASSGIGAQFSVALAQRGFNLLIAARRLDRLQQQATDLSDQYGVQVEALQLDLSEDNFLPGLLAACANKELGLIVSNAGFGLKGLHHLNDADSMDQMLKVNCRAPMQICHALTPQLIKHGGGGIILTGSIEGFMGFPYSAAYAASKAFLHSLGDALWQELKPHHIDVLVLAPGSTNTEALSLQGIEPENMRGLMDPLEVANAALRSLGRKRILIAGLGNRLLVKLLGWLPRKWSLAATEKGMRDAIRKS